jgi:hypothetical protein
MSSLTFDGFRAFSAGTLWKIHLPGALSRADIGRAFGAVNIGVSPWATQLNLRFANDLLPAT